MRKPRIDSPLNRLTEEQQDEVFALSQGKAIEDVLSLLGMPEAEGGYGLRVSRSALYAWLAQERGRRFVERLKNGRTRIDEVVADLPTPAPGSYDAVILEAVKEYAVDMLAQGSADTGDLVNLVKIIGQARRQDIEEQKLDVAKRRVALLEKKAAAYDQIKAAATTKGGLTQETLTLIEQEAGLL